MEIGDLKKKKKLLGVLSIRIERKAIILTNIQDWTVPRQNGIR